MTRNEFAALCAKYMIAPAIALENETIVEALRKNDTEAVEKGLREEF